jgi:threonine dehydrogenase-like Zn-dependent dehydrogenase
VVVVGNGATVFVRLKPNVEVKTVVLDDGNRRRLVVDVLTAAPKPSPPAQARPLPPKPRPQPKVVVLDPGHGGLDPGAVGFVVEKEVTLDLALRSVRDGGTLLLFGAKPDAAFPVDGWELWRREINLVTSYSATPDLFPRALAILRRSRYTLETTVSHVFALEKGPEAFHVAHQGLASKVVIACE